ncbi:MAG: hypothetical protein Q8R28_07965 [Dehalococcoidia bacterium]|nr:hypothetical protein [Dehalococcoidia bacterium]
MRTLTQQQTVASGFTSFTSIPTNRVGLLRQVTVNIAGVASGTVALHFRDAYTRQQPPTASSEVTDNKFVLETSREFETRLVEDMQATFKGVPQVRSEVSGAIVTLAFDVD